MSPTPELLLRLRDPARDLALVRSEVSSDLDAWLSERGARGWTLFLGLDLEADDEKGRRARARFRKLESHPVELADPGSEEPPLQGVLVLDLAGEKARRLGRDLGVRRILRGVAGRPFDPEAQGTEEEAVLAAARRGLVELLSTARELMDRPGAREGLPALVGAVLVVLAYAAFPLLAPRFPLLQRVPFSPVVLPVLVFGGFLRWRLGPPRGEVGWAEARTELFAVWAAVVPTVLVLVGVELWSDGELLPTELFDEFGTRVVLVLWLLPALALASSFGAAIGNFFAAGFKAILSVVLLKFASFFANFAVNLFLGSLRPFLLRLLPEELVEVSGQVLEVLAELGFLLLLLGHAWTRQRPWFEGEPDPLEA